MKLRMIAVLLAALLLPAAGAHAADWVHLGSSTQGDGTKVDRYYDRASVTRNGNYADYVGRGVYSMDQPFENLRFAQVLVTSRMNCAARQYAGLRLDFYDRGGKHLGSRTPDKVEFRTFGSGSFIDLEYQRVCR